MDPQSLIQAVTLAHTSATKIKQKTKKLPIGLTAKARERVFDSTERRGISLILFINIPIST
jgi:hypothetical protein